MKKILVATEKPFAKPAVNEIEKVFTNAGYELVLLEKYKEKKELLDAVADVDGLMIRSDKVTPEVLESAEKLKVVVRAGAGYDNVDLEASTKRGVVVMNTPGQNSNAVAELALGMMVYTSRNFFNGTSGTELRGKKLGVFAYGNIGKNIARIARGFNMIVYGYDPYVDCSVMEYAGMICVKTAAELFENSQYVSLNAPVVAETKGVINYEVLKLMPNQATLVNTARKELVDEESLLKMFAERPDFKYISDVAPDCYSEIAEKYPGRYFFTPKKMGAQTSEANLNAGVAAAKQIVGFFERGDKEYQVNR